MPPVVSRPVVPGAPASPVSSRILSPGLTGTSADSCAPKPPRGAIRPSVTPPPAPPPPPQPVTVSWRTPGGTVKVELAQQPNPTLWAVP